MAVKIDVRKRFSCLKKLFEKKICDGQNPEELTSLVTLFPDLSALLREARTEAREIFLISFENLPN